MDPYFSYIIIPVMALLLTVGFLDFRDQARSIRIAREGAKQSFKQEACPHCESSYNTWNEELDSTDLIIDYVVGYEGPFVMFQTRIECPECKRVVEYLVTNIGTVELAYPEFVEEEYEPGNYV